MAATKKTGKNRRPPGKAKAAKKAPYDGSRAAFETAFRDRIGQTPGEFIQMKLGAGSEVSAVKYLYEITAASIAAQYNRCAWPFSCYYPPKGGTKMPEIKRYNKLVRDRIPEIIRSSGKSCTTEILDQQRYIQMLDAKLEEELREYQQSKSLEELADLLEVMGAVVRARGYTWDQLRQVRMKKKEERGGFEKKILLKEVIEK